MTDDELMKRADEEIESRMRAREELKKKQAQIERVAQRLVERWNVSPSTASTILEGLLE